MGYDEPLLAGGSRNGDGRACEPPPERSKVSSTTPIRVGFVLHVMQVAGAEVLVDETIRRLGPRIDPVVFCLDAVGTLGERLLADKIPVLAYGRRPGLDWSVSRRMAVDIRNRQVQILH